MARSDSPAAPVGDQMPTTKLDDLAFDPVAGILPFAHATSVTRNEITALDFPRRACHSVVRAPLSN